MKSTAQQQKEYIKQRLNENAATVEIIKNTLRRYSRLLRRDFLMSLVRLCALELHIRTTRSDWRTRDGSLLFLSEHWNGFHCLLEKEGFIRWFCYAYSRCIGVLSNRHFVNFLYQNWDSYKLLFDNKTTIAFISVHRSAVESALKGAPAREVLRDLVECDVCASVVSVIEAFIASGPEHEQESDGRLEDMRGDELFVDVSAGGVLEAPPAEPVFPDGMRGIGAARCFDVLQGPLEVRGPSESPLVMTAMSSMPLMSADSGVGYSTGFDIGTEGCASGSGSGDRDGDGNDNTESGSENYALSAGDTGNCPFEEFEDDFAFGADDGLSLLEYDDDFLAVELCM